MINSISKCSLLLTLLLCNVCINGVITQAKPNTRLLANPPNSRLNTNVKLDNLIDDVVLLIFVQLDFDDLIYMSATNSKFNKIAEMVFHQKYSDYEIRIISSVQIEQCPKFHVSEDWEKFIEIPESQWIEDVFKYAGKWIHKIAIESDNMYNRSKLTDTIVTYTAESLVELQLNYIECDTFESFTVPFTALEELHFSIDEGAPSANMLPLNQIFPNLRRMSVSLSIDLDNNLFDCKFSQLEHVEVSINYYNAKKQKDDIECLLRKNPQIQSLTTWGYPSDYVITINKLLPKLANLTLYEFGGLKETVHFENVKNLQMFEKAPNTLDKITFSQLESILMDFNDNDEWMIFFKNHRNLNKLDIYRVTEEQLLEITADLPDLMELKVQTDSYMHVDVDTIIQIIQNHKRLMKFSFPAEPFEDFGMIKKIRELIGNEWRVERLCNMCYLGRMH